ncbi:hypothetical protein FIU86_04375 [Roseovarius sp. THAF9]|uniref:hypothetical protein n=1 Tax=Roseovarius sp. THAF9 TaxID=2587847 RepID=UPI001267AF69|nr:hypothetical protein [Roseovarius sp. THAF9]QFT92067.1 hypothetical protein FIU86_04375 [Roseovarius sp. THAF9]
MNLSKTALGAVCALTLQATASQAETRSQFIARKCTQNVVEMMAEAGSRWSCAEVQSWQYDEEAKLRARGRAQRERNRKIQACYEARMKNVNSIRTYDRIMNEVLDECGAKYQ